MALLAVLGFGCAALPSLLFPGPSADPLPRHSHPSSPAAVATAPGAETGSAEHDPAEDDAGDAAPRNLANRPPTIESVVFATTRATTASNLRLRIQASDPDGEIVRVKTRWAIDGLIVKTDTPVLPRHHFQRGATIRAAVVATDGVDDSTSFVTEEIVVQNAPPRFTTFPSGFGGAGSFVYFLDAMDSDVGDDLEFRLLEGPLGMQIDPDAGVLSWHASFQEAEGRVPVRLEVRDNHGGVDLQSFELNIRPPASRALVLRDEVD
jgi:hypothetical protein